MRLGSSGGVILNPGGFGGRRVSHDNPGNVHICGSQRFKHHQSSMRRKMVAREEKKAKCWAPHPSGPHPSGPHFFWVWATPFGAHHDTHQIQNWTVPNWPNQDGQNGIIQKKPFPEPPKTPLKNPNPLSPKPLNPCFGP